MKHKLTFEKRLSILNDAIINSHDRQSEEGILAKFTQTSISMLDADFGFAWIKRAEDAWFRMAYKSPSTPYEPQTPRKNGTNAQVIKKGEPLFVEDIANNPKTRDDAKGHMKAFVSIPIKYNDRLYGSIVICYKNKKNFSKEDRIIISVISNAAARTITINRLYSKLKKNQKELEARVRQRTRELRDSYHILEKDQAKDRALLASIGTGIIATDSDGFITLMNPQAEAITGLSSKKVMGKKLYDISDLRQEKTGKAPLESRPVYMALQKMEPVKSREFFVVKPGGEKVPLSITASPIILKGEIIGAITAFTDITQEKEMDKAKSELISLASHQLRTPLSAINWYAEVLIKGELGKLNPQQKKYMKEIFSANQKMIELVYDFLNVSRIELGTFQVKLSPLDAVDLAKGVINEIAPLSNQKQIQLSTKFGKSLNDLVGDRKIIRIVLQNLLSNAVKYTPAQGQVSLKISLVNDKRQGSSLDISVSDSGYGIPKEHHPKIFTKLFRADNVSKLDTQGSGLGLYITKSLVDFCNGEITFSSKENKGTTFRVRLPLNSWGKDLSSQF